MLKKRDEGKVAEMVVAMFLKRALAVTKENKIIFYDTVRRKEPTKQKTRENKKKTAKRKKKRELRDK